jgi:catechol 2,3-dioxygenase-like lactoylglutathione lyase family enzyme
LSFAYRKGKGRYLHMDVRFFATKSPSQRLYEGHQQTKRVFMKRFHIHIAVKELETNIQFYSRLFGQEPSKQREDYAKWELEDPRVNFAISSRGHEEGVNHLGFQAENEAELSGLRKLALAASDGELFDEGETACCYARSEKHWTIDPSGIAWEHYYTMDDAESFGEDSVPGENSACCVPVRDDAETGSGCCVPNEKTEQSGCC